jgi:hypothetical protein
MRENTGEERAEDLESKISSRLNACPVRSLARMRRQHLRLEGLKEKSCCK